MHVFPGERFRHNPLDGGVSGAYLGRSKSGWMNSELFYGWLSCHFIKSIPAARPVVLLLDGHSSHINLQAAKFARDNDILLYCLPPHCTHALQPCDVGLFKPLKTNWNKSVSKFMCDAPGEVVNKYNFARVFKVAWDETLKPSTIINSFRASGICPVNESAVPKRKLLPSTVYPPSHPTAPPSQPASSQPALSDTAPSQPSSSDIDPFEEDSESSDTDTDVSSLHILEVQCNLFNQDALPSVQGFIMGVKNTPYYRIRVANVPPKFNYTVWPGERILQARYKLASTSNAHLPQHFLQHITMVTYKPMLTAACMHLRKQLMANTNSGSESLTIDSAIRGHHIYKAIWTPILDQILDTYLEEDNAKDAHAVAVTFEGQIVGHMPEEISTIAWFFLKHEGTITSRVTGSRRHSAISGKGLEVPCTYTFMGSKSMIKKLFKLLAK